MRQLSSRVCDHLFAGDVCMSELLTLGDTDTMSEALNEDDDLLYQTEGQNA